MQSEPERVRFINTATGVETDAQARVSVAEAETMLLRLVADGMVTTTVLESGQIRYSLTAKGRAMAKRAYEREQREQGL